MLEAIKIYLLSCVLIRMENSNRNLITNNLNPKTL